MGRTSTRSGESSRPGSTSWSAERESRRTRQSHGCGNAERRWTLKRIVYGPKALHDVLAAVRFLDAETGAEEAGSDLIETITSACEHIARFPEIGRERKELELRTFPIGRYTLYYRNPADAVEVVALLHHSQDEQMVLKEWLGEVPERFPR
jgi:toxin ParE1/3/4